MPEIVYRRDYSYDMLYEIVIGECKIGKHTYRCSSKIRGMHDDIYLQEAYAIIKSTLEKEYNRRMNKKPKILKAIHNIQKQTIISRYNDNNY